MSKDLLKAIAETTEAAQALLKSDVRYSSLGKISGFTPEEKDANFTSNLASEASDLANTQHGGKDAGMHAAAAARNKEAADKYTAVGDHKSAQYHQTLADVHHAAYTRHSASGTVSNVAAKGAIPPISTHADALHKEAMAHDDSNQDRKTLENAAGHMKAGNHKALANTLSYADTYQREKILEHVHPDHWEGLGIQAIDKDKQIRRFEERHPLRKSHSTSDQIAACIAACLACADACAKCREECDDEKISDCCSRCEDACRETAAALQGGQIDQAQIDACKAVCAECAEACASHDMACCQECATACGECQSACQDCCGTCCGSTGLQKAIAETEEAGQALLKSHVKEHTRTSASGAVTQVSAYDDKRRAAETATGMANHAHGNVLIDKPSSMMNAADEHSKAAAAHLEALKEAHKGGHGNQAINEHFHAASRHLQSAHSLRSFHHNKAKAHAVHASEAANNLSAEADQHDWNHGDQEHTSQSLNAGSSLHMLAMEQHHRAAEAHMALANKHFGTEEGDKEMDLASGHREAAAKHGKEVQRLSKVSTDARDAANAATKKASESKSPEDHKAAAEAHRKAAKLDYDSETSAAHEGWAKQHDEMAKEKQAESKPDLQKLRELKDKANNASDKADGSGDLEDHREATDLHRKAAEAFPKDHPAHRYHNEMADYHSDKADKALEDEK